MGKIQELLDLIDGDHRIIKVTGGTKGTMKQGVCVITALLFAIGANIWVGIMNWSWVSIALFAIAGFCVYPLVLWVRIINKTKKSKEVV